MSASRVAASASAGGSARRRTRSGRRALAGRGTALAKRSRPPRGVQRAAGRERLDVRLPVRREGGASPRRSATRVAAARPVQRLDPDRVAGGDEAPVLGRRRGTANMPFSSASAAGPALVEQVQRDLVVGARRRTRAGRERGADLARGCRPRRCRRARRRAVALASGWWPPSTSTIDSRRWPSQRVADARPRPLSSGPRWASALEHALEPLGSAVPCSATMPHMSRARYPAMARAAHGSPRRAAVGLPGGGRRGGRCTQPRLATAPGASMRATASPRGRRSCASTAPSGSTTLPWPRKRSGPSRPVWFGRHPDDLVLDRAGCVERGRSGASGVERGARARVGGGDRPRRQRGDESRRRRARARAPPRGRACRSRGASRSGRPACRTRRSRRPAL